MPPPEYILTTNKEKQEYFESIEEQSYHKHWKQLDMWQKQNRIRNYISSLPKQLIPSFIPSSITYSWIRTLLPSQISYDKTQGTITDIIDKIETIEESTSIQVNK